MISIKTSTYNFTGTRKADIPRVKTTRYGLRSFRSEAPQFWNSLPNNLRVTGPVPKAAPELEWFWMWVLSVLCLALFFAFRLCVTPLCFALLHFAVLLFILKFYPLSHSFVHLCLRKVSLSELPAGVKSCFYFSSFRFLATQILPHCFSSLDFFKGKPSVTL